MRKSGYLLLGVAVLLGVLFRFAGLDNRWVPVVSLLLGATGLLLLVIVWVGRLYRREVVIRPYDAAKSGLVYFAFMFGARLLVARGEDIVLSLLTSALFGLIMGAYTTAYRRPQRSTFVRTR